MMFFPFGIAKEADIYCASTQISMRNQQEYVEQVVNEISADLIKRDIESLPYNQVVLLINMWAKDYVIQSGWSVTDEDGVSWFLGLFCKSYVRCLKNSIVPFDKIFKDCFKGYFRDK